MTDNPQTRQAPTPRPVVQAFPTAGRRVEHAYRELDIALHGTDQQKKALGSPRRLPRPWDPPTCADPDLRAELWDWLDHVVTWLNHEYVWDATAMIPTCWPRHPHLAHEIAVIADLRRRAGHALTADPLEEWHRYALPAFTDRMRQRTRSHCEDKDHQPWPAQGRHTRHLAHHATSRRADVFSADTATVREPCAPSPAAAGPVLQLVEGLNVDTTGEVYL
jgi:hypothetical protein